ncbi:MAG TPA: MBL fold metallo-hydrolase [Xanthobacteraceae bacterium]|nr:MBL fold metallo-hydrolase [Xanthobacteraceae bacterium]
MHLQFVGSGDAFGSGGRFNTCFQVVARDLNFLIDCGASSLVAMKRLRIDPNAIDLIVLTHYHADHCGGVPFFVLDAQFVAKRTHPLTIAGPPPIREWFSQQMETAFAGSSHEEQKFEVSLVELAPERPWLFRNAEIRSVRVCHGLPPESYHGYRITIDGKVLAFSGDTEWTDSLIELGRDADLFVCEAYVYDRPVRMHLAYRQLSEKLALIRPKRLIITHMSDDMLSRGDGEIAHQKAQDGLIVEI